jgi:lambda family phage portal protein
VSIAAATSRALFGITHGEPPRRARKADVEGRYDSAQTNDGNYRHWAQADLLSARAANDPETRRTLRARCRYECANSGYFKGLVESLAHDAVGTGPRLQLTLLDRPPEQARWVERAWADWCNDEVVDFPDKLRVAKESEVRDGEHFSILVTNPAVRHPVKLDLANVEADQCADPLPPFGDPLAVDGIRFDRFGNPAEYHFLLNHPGDDVFQPLAKVNAVAAEFVIHWFRPARAGQRRGVPALTPGLPVGAILRRYCLATLEAAEVASNIAGVMTNTGLPDQNDPNAEPGYPVYDRIPLERGSLLSLPDGRDAKAFEPSQPTTTFRDFKGENLDEIGRSVHAPSNVVRGNSREYNFSSGRLDYVIYHRAVRIDRRSKERRGINRTFRAWVEEARRVPGVLPPGLPPVSEWQWSWHWDGFESINPVDDANASKILLQLGLTTYSELLAEDGKDWEETFAQRAREAKLRDELGLPDPFAAPAAGSFAGGA